MVSLNVSAALFGIGLSGLLAGGAAAATITVGDGSFESRTVGTSGYSVFPADQANVFGAWENVIASGAEFNATLKNASFGKYANADGTQTGDIGAGPTGTNGLALGIFEDLTNYTTPDPTLVWTAGQTYTMTVAVGSRVDSPVGATSAPLDLRLFYRQADQAGPNVLADTAVPVASVNTTTLTDFTVKFTTTFGDPEIGKPIDVWLVPTAARGTGDWVVANVRLSSAVAAPEPTAVAVAAIAGVATLARRRRRTV